MADIKNLVYRRDNLEIDLELVNAKLETAQLRARNNLPGGAEEVAKLLAQRISIQTQINELNQQILQLQGSGLPTASAGNLVDDDAKGRVNNSQVIDPSTTPEILTNTGRIVKDPDTTSGSNALVNDPVTAVDSGTDAPLRPISQTQSTPLGNIQVGQPLPQFVTDDSTFTGLPRISNSVGDAIGVGASSDDSGSKNLTRTEIDSVFNETAIIPQSNVLDQYASYTYSASLYLMNATDYKAMMQNKTKTLRGAQLLMQSGGAAVGGRNEFFSNDYYIDKIELKSAITGKGTNAAHNVNTVRMTVVEPNGITLISNLDRAVQSYLGSAEYKKKNFASQMYLLVIKFYGYDDQGNLVQGGVAKPDGSSDPNAFVEKWYPLAINKIDFKVANKLVEYEIEATSPSYQIPSGSNRGSIPYNLELSGATVNDVLNGPAVYSSITSTGGVEVDDTGVALLPADAGIGGTTGTTNSAPPKASTAPSNKTTIRQGLMTALNEYQRQLVTEGLYTYPDTYSIEFINPSIKEAKIKNKGSTDKSKIGNSTSQNAADKKVGAKQSADTNSKIATITAGSQLVQVIDQVVRNSSFLEDQQIVIFDPNTQKEIPNGSAAQNLAYFKITMQATPTKYDPKRNDYAYDIKYQVHLYRITESASNYFYVPTYKGVHKQYNYWFTGENTSVISYEQQYNALYTSVLSGGSSSSATILNESIKQNFSPRSAQSSQGADGKVNEPKANLAEFLFNPGDLANCTMTIVGDPAWLQQGEAFAGIKSNDPYFFRAFLADGTINFESQQILFEVLINMPRDYDLSTGIIDPNQQNAVFQNAQTPGGAKQSYVYRANECISEFNKGKFTQILKGTLQQYLPSQTTKANQQTALAQQIDILKSLSQGRVNFSSLLSGSISSPAFLNNLPLVNTLVNGATKFGLNAGANALSAVSQNLLGSAPTRISTVPGNPTSFGLSVGSSVLNSINIGTPPFAGSAPTLVIPEANLNRATVVGTEQQMVAGDDSGYVSNVSNESDPFSGTVTWGSE